MYPDAASVMAADSGNKVLAALSDAVTVEQVIDEVSATRLTERGATRADDRISESGMEDRKKEGYF